MKNPGIFCLLLVCCLCLAFTGGFFVGRNANHAAVSLSAAPAPTAAQAEAAAPTAPATVNINTATAAELETLPGIGTALAQRILDYREANGPFTGVSELMNVEGIGAKKLESIIDYVTVGG